MNKFWYKNSCKDDIKLTQANHKTKNKSPSTEIIVSKGSYVETGKNPITKTNDVGKSKSNVCTEISTANFPP